MMLRDGCWRFRVIELALMLMFLLVFHPETWYQWVYFVIYSALIESIGWVEGRNEQRKDEKKAAMDAVVRGVSVMRGGKHIPLDQIYPRNK